MAGADGANLDKRSTMARLQAEWPELIDIMNAIRAQAPDARLVALELDGQVIRQEQGGRRRPPN